MKTKHLSVTFLTLVLGISISGCVHSKIDDSNNSRANYPAVWFEKFPEDKKYSWEVLPQEAGPGEVILSKRNELGVLSNFAATPFEYRGKKYASVEGFWQMMLFPEDKKDPRAKCKKVKWKHKRNEVAKMVAFEAKKAGDEALRNLKECGIDWVSLEGERFKYWSDVPGTHYQLILDAMKAKLEQNPNVREVLMRTKGLKLRPDHHTEKDAPLEWRYYDLWMKIRDENRNPASQEELDESCDFSKRIDPSCFQKRTTPDLRLLLVRYGNPLPEGELEKTKELFEARFNEATDRIIRAHILASLTIPLQEYPRNLDEIAAKVKGSSEKRTRDRLERLWYYYHPEVRIEREIYEELMKLKGPKILSKIDAVLVLSEPQFDALGFATTRREGGPGSFALTEQPSEVAFGNSEGGSTVFETRERVVDELIHELGHVLGLGPRHPNYPCFKGVINTAEKIREQKTCCEKSASRDDVMSYCRNRNEVNETFFYKFTECTKNFLKESVTESLLNSTPRGWIQVKDPLVGYCP